MISVDSFNIYILTVLDAHVCILQEPITYLNGEFYSNFLTVSISCISCSFFTTLTSWSFLEQQVPIRSLTFYNCLVVTANTSTSHICSQFRIRTLRILNYCFCISISCHPGHSKEFCNAYNAAAGSPNINNNNQGLSTQHETAHCDQLGSSILLPF